MIRSLGACLLLVLALALSACGTSAGGISVNQPWVRAASAGTAGASDGAMASEMPMASDGAMASEMPMASGEMGDMEMGGNNSAAYMTIVNAGSTADRLLSVTSDVAGEVQLHSSQMQDNVMRMEEVEAIDVPANGQAELAPGGLHIMLMNLNRDLVAGERVPLTLTFERAGQVEVEAEVRAP